MTALKDRVKRALGAGRVAALRQYLVPLQLEAVRASIALHGWTLDSMVMTDDQAAVHFANGQEMDAFGRATIRFFHQYKLEFLAKTLTPDYIARSSFLEVGDSDGLVLKALGKSGISINNDPRCIESIATNGIQARLGVGEHLDVPDKSCDVAMAFETLEHSLNPAAFLRELARVARERVIISVPGVSRTMIHPRIKGARVGEEHVFEFCTRDLLRLCTHLPLRLTHHRRMSVFAAPRSVLARMYYASSRNPEIFGGCFRRFDFYLWEVDPTDQGRTAADSANLYRQRR